jgi:hypothetical protein
MVQDHVRRAAASSHARHTSCTRPAARSVSVSMLLPPRSRQRSLESTRENRGTRLATMEHRLRQSVVHELKPHPVRGHIPAIIVTHRSRQAIHVDTRRTDLRNFFQAYLLTSTATTTSRSPSRTTLAVTSTCVLRDLARHRSTSPDSSCTCAPSRISVSRRRDASSPISPQKSKSANFRAAASVT